MNYLPVEPNVIIESSLALAIAIAVTDALRDVGHVVSPNSMFSLAVWRVIIAILVILTAIVLVDYLRYPEMFSQNPPDDVLAYNESVHNHYLSD
jgi:hypothetical protein